MLAHLIVVVVVSVVVSVAAANAGAELQPNDCIRIIGGCDSDIKSYPYQASLQMSGYHICGASVISRNYVVTAAHCISKSEPIAAMSIRVGSNYRERGGSVHRADKVIVHEDYNVRKSGVPVNDIALIKVKPPFIFRDEVQPIMLFSAYEDSNSGEQAIVTGWGSTGGWALPKLLQSVSIPIVPKSVCNKAYEKMKGLPAGQVCAGYYGKGGKDACQGDSGGPLAIGNRLAGIVSWGTGCAEPKFPGVFTEVAYFRKWIDEHADLQ